LKVSFLPLFKVIRPYPIQSSVSVRLTVSSEKSHELHSKTVK
jgi:hypothetical protein